MAALYTTGVKLSDEGMYVVSIHEVAGAPAGVLIKAYHQESSTEYTLTPSESELYACRLGRSRKDLCRLAQSIDMMEIDGKPYMYSKLEGISKPKVIPTGSKAEEYIASLTVGGLNPQPLTEVLNTALCELCKVKPQGLDAVTWLGNWLLANNANQPFVQEPED